VKYLVDANVLSEPTKPAPDQHVIRWLRQHEIDLAIDTIVLGELEYGILLLPAGQRRTKLEKWFAQGIRCMRLLEFDADSASAWARLLARLKKRGFVMPIKDSLIAASALAHGLTVATRNIADYKSAGVRCVNPFHQ
jgi:predicted nucleic acid-binding protein